MLKLPIYDGKKVVKTYTTNTFDCSFGIVEDILDAVDLDSINTKADFGLAVLKCSKQLKPFLLDLFPDMTEQELRKTRIQDVIQIFKTLYIYATGEISAAAGDEKN